MQENKKVNIPERIAGGIVSLRWGFLAFFVCLCVLCVLCIGKVKTVDDITVFLPETTQTRRGVDIMANEFPAGAASAQMMLTVRNAGQIAEFAENIRGIEGVAGVTAGEDEEHYRAERNAALFEITFEGDTRAQSSVQALNEIRSMFSSMNPVIVSEVDNNYSDQLASEMTGVLAIAAAVIVAVLLLTSRSWFEVAVYGIVFGAAALFNMGTNFIFGTISSITSAIAIILQLALSIDYAIIFANRYREERENPLNGDCKAAARAALGKAIREIASSSLTTVSGLAAITLMQFRFGRDLGLVLGKGVLCSMLTVFLLMPALLILFTRPIEKTKHRPLIPSVKKFAAFVSEKKPVFAILFLLLIIPGIVLSSRAEYACWGSTVTSLSGEDEENGEKQIAAVFGYSTPTAVLVPAGNPEAERAFLEKAETIPHVTSALGLSNVQIADGVGLYTPLNAQQIASAFGVEPWKVSMLLGYYAWEKGETVTGEYTVMPMDLAEYLFRQMDDPSSLLAPFMEGNLRQSLLPMKQLLESGKAQLQGEHYSRMVITTDLPAEGEGCRETVEALRLAADECFGPGNAVMTGNLIGAGELREFFGQDKLKISLLTVLFVFVILLFTFRSVPAATVLVFVIQGSIWFNFSATYISGQHPLFLTYTIGSAIQMGATIDYAIVLMSHYRQNRQSLEKRPAMVKALTDSFVTVITSGIIMTAAGLLIAWRVSDVYVCHIGLAVGRGALISVILVLTVLPQLIVLLDRFIMKPLLPALFRKGKKVGEKDDQGSGKQ